jgi:lantibiotic transport system permease protein
MMGGDFIHAFQSEWLKKKRSLGSWLVVVGSLFTPVVVIVARLIHRDQLPKIYAADTFWTSLWRSSWESMAIFFLPMAAILATSLITQIEYRSNAWKQVHTLPISAATLFFSKLAVIVVLMVQFFALFDLGIYLSAVVPCLLSGKVPYPNGRLPVALFLADTLRYMVASFPIVAAQYLLSLRFSNFLLPIGFGFMAWVGAGAALSTRFAYLIPYGYSMLTYLRDDPRGKIAVPPFDIFWLAIAYAALFTIASYWLFVTKAQKG